MNEKISGERLFLLYTWPCALIKLEAREISQKEYDELRYAVMSGASPNKSLLARCFPEAFKHIIDWDFDAVARYWRHEHEHDNKPVKRDVWQAMVLETPSSHIVRIKVNDRIVIAINEYKLPLQVGNMVYVHKQWIIEKI